MSGEGAVYKSGERGWGALSIRTNEIHERGRATARLVKAFHLNNFMRGFTPSKLNQAKGVHLTFI